VTVTEEQADYNSGETYKPRPKAGDDVDVIYEAIQRLKRERQAVLERPESI
jgi:hypothetical protein